MRDAVYLAMYLALEMREKSVGSFQKVYKVPIKFVRRCFDCSLDSDFT